LRKPGREAVIAPEFLFRARLGTHEMDPKSGDSSVDLLSLAYDELGRLDPRQAAIVEARFFGGLDATETAELLQISKATVLRDWRAAKAWLARAIRGER
jgi:DNA-directed RNA polymerase specialized sigma24 family protein